MFTSRNLALSARPAFYLAEAVPGNEEDRPYILYSTSFALILWCCTRCRYGGMTFEITYVIKSVRVGGYGALHFRISILYMNNPKSIYLFYILLGSSLLT
jgi:hypothetical protein